MESFGGNGFSVVGHNIRKKRSDASRKARLNSHMLLQSNHFLPASIEMFTNGSHNEERNNEDKSVACDGVRSGNKLKKLKLKVGGVTRTIHTKSTTDFTSGDCSSTQVSYVSLTAFAPREKSLQDDINGTHTFPSDKRKGFGVKWKNMSKIDSSSQKKHSSRGTPVKYEPVRKSNRVPKRRVLDVGFNEDDDDKDEEIRYLERLNAPKNPDHSENGKDCKIQKEHRLFKPPKSMDGLYDDAVGNYGSPRLAKEFRKVSRSEKDFEDTDYVEEEPISDEEPGPSGKKLKRESPNLYTEGWKESTPITRTRASAASVDLSNCLLSSNSRRKEKLSEMDLQLKKAEAAQRRRMQSEKMAREAEAEAIRKILGQDSGRKKREEKMKKQRDELLQGC
ncbi:uncharacterized protein LOC21387709 isoform X2 [Morus notabilis]|uniref:uncharacterized protein LOC21387709 isoform X2 n=1 Tax=Morus notabilis TaxID=981085 RepID=UPI000CED5227|nr:uncharacterized protein LOC21387709 isoform X2 [Morus notabilis]